MTRTRILTVAAILVPCCWCFGSVPSQDRSFGFRDAANYYYPLFQWECSEWRAGRIPLWNPQDNLGTPVLADTTSSVLYPGKLVFVLPLSYRLRYHIYISAHVLLAAAATYRLARHWKHSREASTLAALAYAFGGSVVFQYCNVVFLVGAAWLPFAVLASDRMLRERSVAWSLSLGAILALMVLGGDPQAAYHAGAIAALYALLLRFDSRRSLRERTFVRGANDDVWQSNRLMLLCVAAISGIALSLVQILPAMEWSNQSSRRAYDRPRNIYEAGHFVEHARDDKEFTDKVSSGILGQPKQGSHLRHVYEFSVGPWHVAEFVWPNVFGRMFPINERWSNAIPAEGRTWTPSLYLGLLPIILAMFAWRVRRTDACTKFLAILTIIGIVGSFGWYGLGWLCHEVRAAMLGQDTSDLAIGSPVGGLYWFFVTFLPGYVYFRYPAKLLVIASLGISLLAARGWDDFVVSRPRSLAAAFATVAGLSLTVAACFGVFQTQWHTWLNTASADSIFGPLDIEAATTCVLAALLHSTVLSIVLWLVLRSERAKLVRRRAMLLVAVTAIEIALANGWMTATVPASVWSESPSIANAIPATTETEPPNRMYRGSPAKLLPNSWSKQSDENRLADVVAWEHATLLPKHHLGSNIAIVGSHTTLESARWQSFLRLVRQQESKQPNINESSLLDIVSTQYVTTNNTQRSSIAVGSSTPHVDSVQSYPRTNTFPRVWIVLNVTALPPLDNHASQNIHERTREIFFDDDQLRDLYSVAIVETNEDLPGSIDPSEQSTPKSADKSCVITDYSPQRVEIEVTLNEPAYVVLNDTYYPGWHAKRVTDEGKAELTIYRANSFMRAVHLPAGKQRIVYTYRPPTLIVGAMVSICAWLILIASTIHWKTRRKSQNTTTDANLRL